MKPEASELIINPDGSVYHLSLLPQDIADTILLVGDPGRVEMISGMFDKIEVKKQNREFITHTGTYKGKRVTVMSSGIGTDNIDIVINELDALVNFDLSTREIKEKKTSLTFIRLGTSGALQEDIPVHTFVRSDMAIGFDGLLNFYRDRNSISDIGIEKAFKEHVNWNELLPSPYFVKSCERLASKFPSCYSGLTISAPGFFGPQGRVLRLPIVDADINSKITSFRYQNLKISNYEMESSALYGLSKLLGHHALTICTIIANRLRKEYSKDYKVYVKKMVEMTLDTL